MANAQAGRNLDILELARLTVPIRINQGGHGSTDAKQGLTNLIVNADGVPFKDTDYSGTLKRDTLTANRTWTLPDATGTIALTSSSGFRNLIINGNFNVNQRGYTSGTATTAANQYTLDRWYIEASGDDVTFAASGNGNEITIGSGVNFGQVVAGENIFDDTYTLSWGGTATAKVNGTACDKGGQVTLAANTDAKIVFTGGTLSQVQLEPGGMQTGFEQRLVSMELSLCQRYYVQVSANFRVYATIASTNWESCIYAPVPMRASPATALLDPGTTGGLSSGYPKIFAGNNTYARFVLNNSTANIDCHSLGALIELDAEIDPS